MLGWCGDIGCMGGSRVVYWIYRCFFVCFIIVCYWLVCLCCVNV